MGGFAYRRAALILAETQFLGTKAVLARHNIPKGTYDNWKQRLKTDPKLQKMYQQCLEEMTSSWQAEAIQTLKKAMEVTRLGLENNPFGDKPTKDRAKELWGKNMSAMSHILKTMGDLNISTHVLMEEDDDDDDDELDERDPE